MQLKGYGNEFIFHIELDENVDDEIKEIDKILAVQKEYFLKNPVSFKLNRELTSNEDFVYVNKVQSLFMSKGICLNNYSSNKIIKDFSLINQTHIIWKSIRAGSKISIPDGNLIVFGDINQGAEVEVAGFVVCTGVVKGSVKAGEFDNEYSKYLEDVFVYAGKINSPRIQIKDKISYNVKERGVILKLD